MSWWCYVEPENAGHESFEMNLTYNVGTMIRRAGIHPDILSGLTVERIKPVVEHAYMVMYDNPEYFRQFNAANGWGTYETTLEFVTKLNTYLATAPDDYVMRWS